HTRSDRDWSSDVCSSDLRAKSLPVIEQHGLKLVSTGSDFARLKSDPDAAVANAKRLGVKYVMCSWIPHPKAGFTEKEARDAIERSEERRVGKGGGAEGWE